MYLLSLWISEFGYSVVVLCSVLDDFMICIFYMCNVMCAAFVA